MAKLTIHSLEEFQQYEGKEIGISDYHTITQEQINKFADATLDHQWIHTDPAKAAKETEFGSTIAHGYLTLSLLPYLWGQIVEFQNVKMMVNYGIEDFRFNQAVKVGSRVRMVATMKLLKDLRGITRAHMGVVLEIEGSRKPAYEGTIVFVYHFK